jgi:hypothetical protein
MTAPPVAKKELGCGGGLAILAAAVALYLGFVWVFAWLWNWLVPDLFGGPALTYWQALGLWLLLAAVSGLFRSSGKAK